MGVALCKANDCDARANSGGLCLGHLDDREFKQAVRDLGSRSAAVDAGDTVISPERVVSLLAQLAGAANRRLRQPVSLRGAIVTGDLTLRLGDYVLAAPLDLTGARIEGKLTVAGVRGLGFLHLGQLSEDVTTSLSELVIEDCVDDTADVALASLDLPRGMTVRRCQLRSLLMAGVRTPRSVSFLDVEFARDLTVHHCAVSSLRLQHVRLGSGISLHSIRARSVDVLESRFESWADMQCAGSVSLRRATFEGPARINWSPGDWPTEDKRDQGREVAYADIEVPGEPQLTLELASVRFNSSAQLRWTAGGVKLSRSVFEAASSLGQAERASGPPRLIEVGELDGAALRLGRVDLTQCRLGMATTLGPLDPSRLRAGWGSVGLTWRRFLFDEGERASVVARLHGRRTDRLRERAPELAATYRELRKSSEDVGNFAAANDLFYGERLWTRKASRVWSFQWLWLAGYGLVGYGVRPWRSLAWLIALVLAAAVGLGLSDGLSQSKQLDGRANEQARVLCERNRPPVRPQTTQQVTCPTTFSSQLEFALRATTSLARPASGYSLSGVGVAIEIALRLLAPLMFGLFVVAIRNRVRR
jgi:hypothetical protein